MLPKLCISVWTFKTYIYFISSLRRARRIRLVVGGQFNVSQLKFRNNNSRILYSYKSSDKLGIISRCL